MNYTIISDRDNEQRRNLVNSEFKKIGIVSPTYTDAIMATKMTDNEVYSYTIPDTYLTKGQVGCALSHKKVYEAFLKSDVDTITIFEDDILFSGICNLDLLNNIIESVSNWEFPFVLALQKSRYHGKKIFDVNKQVSIYSSHNLYCTHGYIINKAAARNILTLQTPIQFEIDMFKFYYWLGATNLFCLNQNLVVQTPDLPSTIDFSTKKAEYIDMLQRRTFKTLYKHLNFKEKINVQKKRIMKAINKPFEGLNY